MIRRRRDHVRLADEMSRLMGHTLPELARLQIELEYDLTADGSLSVRDGSDDHNLCSLYLCGDAVVPYFRADVPAAARATVESLAGDEILTSPALLVEVLGGETCERYETYVCSGPFAGAAFPDVREVAGRFVVQGDDGTHISSAWSFYSDDCAAEVAVETAEPYRRRGYATQVTAAWAARQLSAGRVPFFSHRTANVASAAVAARLGLARAFTVVTVE